MNYCINLKKRKNKPYCNIIKKEISFSRCRECVNKEYKTQPCKLEYRKMHNNKKMRIKSNKLAKLERERFSVFTDDLEHCIICGKPREHLHKIIYGKNRINSIKYNFVIPLCANHHTGKDGIHFNKDLDLYYKRLCQIYFENNIGNRIEFIKIFGRNYLE